MVCSCYNCNRNRRCTMLMCYNLFIKNSRPNFLTETLSIFNQADKTCFLDRATLDRFINNLKKQLEKDKPVGSSWRIWEYKDPVEGGGQISIERSDVPDMTVARVQYKNVAKVLRYSTERGRFIDVAYRLED